MCASRQSFGDDFQDKVSLQVENGLTDAEICKHIQDTHAISVSQQTLTQRKEDWGLILQATEHSNQLEDHIQTYFEQGLSYSQIHHALTTSHDYTQSFQTLERKIQSMNRTRRTDDLDNNKVNIETIVSCVQEIHQTPKGQNIVYQKKDVTTVTDKIWL
jgi:hypothetical protein